jgi:mRNA interferase HigB
MNVISFKRIRDFTALHSDSRSSLQAWYTVVKKARWQSLVDVKRVYPTADLVERYTVFNINGTSIGWWLESFTEAKPFSSSPS